MRAIAAPMIARSIKCSASAPIVAPTSRTIDLRHGAQANLGHGHQSAGVASRDRAIGLAFLHRFDRLPHRRRAPTGAQGLARLIGHFDRDVAMAHARLGLQGWIARQQRRHRRLVAEQEELDVRPSFEGDRGRLEHDWRSVIAAHYIERYADVPFHTLFLSRGGPAPLRRAAQ
jgi:hypothetical protein